MLLLVQEGDRLCGRFMGMRADLSQVDEGAPRSIRGLVVGDVAVLVATSSRNEETYLVRLERRGRGLRWRIGEQVGTSANGDADLFPVDEMLVEQNRSQVGEQLMATKAECRRR
ncbi:hypothetical protein RZV16_03430 [Xanthomonas cannabis]|uniref:hypothetical protein n=1 Tax=Xanthomonas TaxID=338 RepID=UPI00141B55CC|nr:hypothetical protein [Xanthomonas euroxanthea]NIK08466.1 hypothetical protein [Xanthomonas euroxanthea]